MTNEDLRGLVRVEEHHVLRHRVLDEEVLEVPETEVGNLGNPAIGHDQHVTGFKISMDNWIPQVVKIAHTLNKRKNLFVAMTELSDRFTYLGYSDSNFNSLLWAPEGRGQTGILHQGLQVGSVDIISNLWVGHKR